MRPKQALVLSLLSVRPHGALALELVEASDGVLQRATIYVTLASLENKGWVESEALPEDRDPAQGVPRRRYTITSAGQRAISTV